MLSDSVASDGIPLIVTCDWDRRNFPAISVMPSGTLSLWLTVRS